MFNNIKNVFSSTTLQELLQPNQSVLQNEIQKFLDEEQEESLPAKLSFDFSFDSDFKRIEKKMLAKKLTNAIDGMILGESTAQAATSSNLLTQQDYLQLPLLALETHAHGLSLAELIDNWDAWITNPFTPEKIISKAVKQGCPVDQIGTYQAFSDQNLSTVQRAMCWGLPYAGNAEKAAQMAYLDASISGYGEICDTAAFFAAVIALSFTQEPIKAIHSTLYGMSFSFIQRFNQSRYPTALAPDATPFDHCIALIHVIQATQSLKDCFTRLKSIHAAPCCFIAAGALYEMQNVNTSAQNEQLSSQLAFHSIVFKNDLVKRYITCHSSIYKNQYAWK